MTIGGADMGGQPADARRERRRWCDGSAVELKGRKSRSSRIERVAARFALKIHLLPPDGDDAGPETQDGPVRRAAVAKPHPPADVACRPVRFVQVLVLREAPCTLEEADDRRVARAEGRAGVRLAPRIPPVLSQPARFHRDRPDGAAIPANGRNPVRRDAGPAARDERGRQPSKRPVRPHHQRRDDASVGIFQDTSGWRNTSVAWTESASSSRGRSQSSAFC